MDPSLFVLVRQYAYGQMAYEAFRARFVAQFLAERRDEQSRLSVAVNAIESACADYDENDLSEKELRDELSSILSGSGYRIHVG